RDKTFHTGPDRDQHGAASSHPGRVQVVVPPRFQACRGASKAQARGPRGSRSLPGNNARRLAIFLHQHGLRLLRNYCTACLTLFALPDAMHGRVIGMKSRWLYFFGAGCTLCLAGCLSSTARQPIEQPPQPPETKPEQIIKTVAVTEDGFPRLFLRRRDVRDSVALAEQGLAVSESEFEAGYQRGALPDKISEEDYRRRLREDLLLL